MTLKRYKFILGQGTSPHKYEEWIPYIYLPELEKPTDKASFASLVNNHIEFEDSSHLSIKVPDKRDDFVFKIIHYPSLCINRTASSAYSVCIFKL